MNKQFIPNPIVKRAFLTPDRQAITFEERSYTFQEIFDLSYEKAGRLQGMGVRKGQNIALLLRNHIDTVVVMLSLQLLGATAVVLNNRLTSNELLWQINDSKVTLTISEEALKDKLDTSSTFVSWKEQLGPFEEPIIQEEIDLDDVCTIMYTSGTTGNPKGVLQTYGNHWWSATGSALNLGLREDDCWLCSVPLFHISGFSILMRSVFYGMRIILHDTFNEKKTLLDVQDKKVTIMSVVTTMLSRLLEELDEKKLPEFFRCMLLGGGPAPLPILERCVEKEIPVYQTYGMTETASQIVTLSPEDSMKKIGSAGKPLFPSQLKIVDNSKHELGPNQSGEIVVKGPNVTIGYLNREEVNKEQFIEGWFKTGDIGFVDEEGFLYVQDRRSDLIISGGENIYPAEIEGILTSHPDIVDAGVIGKDDERWGQIPVAFVLKKDPLTEEKIVQFCSNKLAKYKIPKEIYFVDSIPRNASKKLLRRELRKLLE